MPLSAGEKLGSYEILSPLGAGGMGEVYRARDAKLGREVAIKVLPEEFTQHPQKLARFEREARLLAALNHPGIATLYGVEEKEGKPFLVMELVEGETLAERISRGPLPLKEALTLAQQIAEALDAAHEKGVIHRDLKPANIKVDPEGKVKVLDFGLAKVFAEETAETDTSFSPTLSRDATRAGVILGTAAYMSPEQAKGKTVDKRTDVFSFGIVLYEMLAGKRAFSGEDVSDVLARILASEPDWKALSGKVSPSVVKLLGRCLAKDRRKRLRDIADAHYAIQEILAEPADASSLQPVTFTAPSRTRERVLWGLAILVASVAVWALMRAEPPSPQPITRFSIVLPPGDNFTRGGRPLVALSPDGTRLVYVANSQLYLREMDEMEAAPIRGTDVDPSTPFFSPDGEWIGFWSGTDSRLKKVAVTGGAPVTLCEAGNPYGASWGTDDTIVFGQGALGILQVSANGGVPDVLIPMDSDENEIAHGPQMLPDGNTILFTLSTTGTWDDSQVVAQSLETSERRVLVEGGSDALYLRTGHLVYALGATLLAIPFDVARLEVTGGPVPVVEGVSRAVPSTGAAHAAFSDSGSLVYVSGVAQPLRTLVWVDRQGGEEPLPVPPSDYGFPRLSPDGERLAVIDRGDVWIHSVARGTSTRLTFTEDNNYLAWTPDGQRVIFSSSRGGIENLFWKAADGSDEATQLTTGQFGQHPDSTSPDGRLLAFHEHDATSGTDLWVLPLEGEGEPQSFLETPFNERVATFSQNGRWLAYVSNESARDEIYAQPFPGPGGKHQISTQGGRSPLWRGQELFYRTSNNETMVVDITAERGLTTGAPRLLFQKTEALGAQIRMYDITPDGERFVMVLPADASSEIQQINVVLNWFEELKRLVSTD